MRRGILTGMRITGGGAVCVALLAVPLGLLAGACTKSNPGGGEDLVGPSVTGPTPPPQAPPPQAPPPQAPPPAPPAPPSSTTSMRWVLTDGCNDGRGLRTRFFDKTNNLMWPDAERVYVAGSGGSVEVSLGANAGATICYGAAKDPDDRTYWGIGLDGNQGCASCCYTAAATTIRINLSC